MKLGLVQMDIVWENIEENCKKVEYFFKQAKKKQIDVLVFPEMTLTGFSMHVEKITENWERQPDFFGLMSKLYGIAVVFGYAAPEETADDGDHSPLYYTNHLAIMDRGRCLLDYTKIHPFSYGTESKYFRGGNGIYTTVLKNMVLGGFVCYDLRFPEIFQISSEKSEIIFVIANWPKERIGHWDALLRARAIENQCYIVGVNRSGRGGGLLYNGHSALYAPDGERITDIQEGECLLVAEADADRVRHYRGNFPVKKDRKKELYRSLMLGECSEFVNNVNNV